MIRIPGLNTYDATAGVGDIVAPLTAYVAGQKLTGVLVITGGSITPGYVLIGVTYWDNGVLKTGTLEIIGQIKNSVMAPPIPVVVKSCDVTQVSDYIMAPPIPVLAYEAEQIAHV